MIEAVCANRSNCSEVTCAELRFSSVVFSSPGQEELCSQNLS